MHKRPSLFAIGRCRAVWTNRFSSAHIYIAICCAISDTNEQMHSMAEWQFGSLDCGLDVLVLLSFDVTSDDHVPPGSQRVACRSERCPMAKRGSAVEKNT